MNGRLITQKYIFWLATLYSIFNRNINYILGKHLTRRGLISYVRLPVIGVSLLNNPNFCSIQFPSIGSKSFLKYDP